MHNNAITHREFSTFHEAVGYFAQFQGLNKTRAQIAQDVKRAVEDGRIIIKEPETDE